MIFETHAHYDDEQYDRDREQILASLSRYGVGRVVNVAAGRTSVETTWRLVRRYPFMYGALGFHPDETYDMTEADLQRIRALVTEDRAAGLAGGRKIVAVGEIGLDYYHDDADPAVQREWFARQLELSNELALPAVIHSREAAQDTYDALKALKRGEGAAVIHCFSYGKEMARRFLELGHYVGLGGVVTFKNAKHAKEVAAYVPLDRLLLETDSPYLAPVPYRGKRNFSGYIRECIVPAIAALRGISEAEVIDATRENADRFYRLGAYAEGKPEGTGPAEAPDCPACDSEGRPGSSEGEK
ncbi:MAG: TatD family hydrolase [Lachnospiraceae bacterium]|nr:TatD family hydrolase [Lachnospiraceae bacterium]